MRVAKVCVEREINMANNNSKGRGRYTDPIELKYIQLSHEAYKILMEDGMQIPEASRKEALWFFFSHYFTNTGYEALKLKDPLAYMICRLLDESHFSVQNNSRWKCFDEFYKGDISKSYNEAYKDYQQEVKDKRKATNKKYYLKRKQQEYNPEAEHEEGKETLKDAMKKHGIEFDEDDFNY